MTPSADPGRVPAVDPPPAEADAPRRLARVETLLDAALAAARQGTLAELLLQRPRAARWLMRGLEDVARASAGEALGSRPAEMAALLLRWGVIQLRPDGLPGEAPIPPEAWFQAGWRPMLALASHAGYLKVPDFPGRYRRRPDETALDNLCGLWEVAPSSFYRYLDRARQALAVLRDEAAASVPRRLSLRQAAADETARQLGLQDDPAARAAWHARQVSRAIEQRDAASALWHAWRAGDRALFISLLRQHAPALAAAPETEALVERLASGALDTRGQFELALARAALARAGNAPERELQSLERALQVAQGAGDRLLLGIAYGALGKFHEPRDADRAFACYQDSAEFLRGPGTFAADAMGVEHYLTTLARLAWLYVLRNDPRARPLLDQAETLRASHRPPDDVLGVLEQTWGEYWRRAGEPARSLEHRYRALNLFERVGDERSVLATWLNLIQIHGELKDFERAIEYSRKVLDVAARRPVEAAIVVSTRLNLGATLFWQERLDLAIAEYGHALALSLEAGLRLHAFRARYNLAEAHYTRFRLGGRAEDERLGDAYRQAALDAPASDSNPAAIEAARQLKAEILGDGSAPQTDRLLPDEAAVHAEAFAVIRRQREQLAVPGAPEAQVQAHLALARAYLDIAIAEREVALGVALRFGLAAAHAAEFEALTRRYARETGRERQLAAAWRGPAGDLLDEGRRMVLAALLLGEGEVGKSAYAQACGVAPATASKHLSLLTARGLLVQSGKGPSTRYRLAPDSGNSQP